MANAFDQFDQPDVVNGSETAARMRAAWPNRQLSDAQLGVVPRRQAGLGNAGLPAGYVVDRDLPDAPWAKRGNAGLPAGYVVDRDLPDAPWAKPGKPANYFDRFDPDEFLKSKPDLPDAPWSKYPRTGGMFDDLIPNAPSYGTGESAWEGYLKGASRSEEHTSELQH